VEEEEEEETHSRVQKSARSSVRTSPFIEMETLSLQVSFTLESSKKDSNTNSTEGGHMHDG
jgi:hypothetical protein